jgi:cytochrome P450
MTTVPPGRLGPPFVGQTLALVRNPFAFVERRHRRHGPVFKSRILGRTIVFLAGREGAEAFYDDTAISRQDAHPASHVELFGGRNMEMYDGDRHRGLKTITRAAFDDAALVHYLPDLQRLIEGRLEGWAAGDEISATAELRKLAIEAICLNLLGLEPGAATDRICLDYTRVLKGMVSVPTPVPGTPYGRARAARDRLLATIRDLVVAHRAAANPPDDGLTRLLAARTPDGRACTDEEAVLEVHHVVIAGFIVYALMGEVLRRLPERPDVAARCRAEVAEHAPPHTPLTVAGLRRMTTVTNLVMEAKRHVPLVPLAFGRARHTITVGGHDVPEGWRVYLSLRVLNLDPTVFHDPDTFDPDRFAAPRAEHHTHPLAFIPQGAGPPTGHQCLGLDYSTLLVLAFTAALLRGYEWDVPAQDFTLRWGTIPPEPKDGLRVRLRPRRPAASDAARS